MRILVIQSRTRPEMLEAEQNEYLNAVGSLAEISFISSLNTEIDWKNSSSLLEGISLCIIGGTGEYDFDGGRDDNDEAKKTSYMILSRLTPFLDYIFESDFPTLGICYGHQIIGIYKNERVFHDLSQNKVGSFEVELTAEGKKDKLLNSLPEKFIAQYGHKDSLENIPTSAVPLAIGSRCKASALKYSEYIYTFQFHPELTAADVGWKLKNSPGYIPESGSLEEIIFESPETYTLIPRFVEIVSKQKNYLNWYLNKK